jgi:hypothetical protein
MNIIAKIEIGPAPSQIIEETSVKHYAGAAMVHGYNVTIGPAAGQTGGM